MLLKTKDNNNNNTEFKVSAIYDSETFFLLNKEKLKNTKKIIDFNDIIFLSKREIVDVPLSLTKLNIKKFIQHVYDNNIHILNNKSTETEKEWRKIENVFFKLSFDIYGESSILEKKYIIFPSVLSSFIRDFKNKRISFPYNTNKKDALFVIAHELLHVIFYQYLYKNYPKIRTSIGSKKIYDFSEVINVIIQEQKEWVKIFTIKPGVYKGQEKLYEKMNQEWKNNHDIDSLIKKIL